MRCTRPEFHRHTLFASSFTLAACAAMLAPSAVAIPLPTTEADATAKWETIVIPSLPVTHPTLAQQTAIIPLGSTFDTALSVGTALLPESLFGPAVRGFSEVAGVSPNSQGGGTLEGSSHARLVANYVVTGTGPVDLDIDVVIDGSLEAGNYATDTLGSVTSGVEFEAYLHTDAGVVPLFVADAVFDVAATSGFSVLNTAGDWTPGDFTAFSPSDFFNQERRINLVDTNENAAILNPGDRFAIELVLNTDVYVAGAFELAARSDFDSTGAFTLSTDTAGGGFVQVVVPEPSTVGLLACCAIAWPLRRCRRHFHPRFTR